MTDPERKQLILQTKANLARPLQAALDTNDAALAKVYREHREGTSNAWYEARAAFDLLAQFRHDVLSVLRALERKDEN